MSKRKSVRFGSNEKDDADDDDLEQAYNAAVADKVPKIEHKQTRFKEKHSLDSDEEDSDREIHGDLNEEELDAQEDGDVDFKEGIQITPFNMKEEMEEGHFDENGAYIFKKEKKDIRDSWLDDIDWVKVKEREQSKPVEGLDDDSIDLPALDKIGSYKSMIELMKPGESVLKAIKRLGGGAKSKASSASQRWKKPKPGQVKDSNPQPEADKEGMLKLTGYADELLANGHLEIYQDSYEKLAFLVKQSEAAMDTCTTPPQPGTSSSATPGTSASETPETSTSETPGTSATATGASRVAADDLDMFADEPPPQAQNGEKNGTADTPKAATTTVSAPASSLDDEVMWEYKWSEKEDEEMHGPFSSAKMLAWQEEGFFAKGAFCRRVKVQGPFYPTSRVDFDLYT